MSFDTIMGSAQSSLSRREVLGSKLLLFTPAISEDTGGIGDNAEFGNLVKLFLALKMDFEGSCEAV